MSVPSANETGAAIVGVGRTNYPSIGMSVIRGISSVVGAAVIDGSVSVVIVIGTIAVITVWPVTVGAGSEAADHGASNQAAGKGGTKTTVVKATMAKPARRPAVPIASAAIPSSCAFSSRECRRIHTTM